MQIFSPFLLNIITSLIIFQSLYNYLYEYTLNFSNRIVNLRLI